MPSIMVRTNDLITSFVDVIVEGQVAQSMLQHDQLRTVLQTAFGVSDNDYAEIVMEYQASRQAN